MTEEPKKEKTAKYQEEKGQIEADAKRLEKIRDEAKNHSSAFGMAVIFLQLAILLSSIAAIDFDRIGPGFAVDKQRVSLSAELERKACRNPDLRLRCTVTF